MAWAAHLGEGQRSTSLKWFALRPDGPGAEPAGKELTALTTSTSVRETGVGVGFGGIGGGGSWGCLTSISFQNLGVTWARPSADKAWMAFLYCPFPMVHFARLVWPSVTVPEGAYWSFSADGRVHL